MTYKKPKKQKWRKGDIFIIPLSDQIFAVAQVLEKISNYTALCALFEGEYREFEIPLLNFQIEGLKVVLTVLSNDLDNYTFKVITNRMPVISVPNSEDYYDIRHNLFDSCFLAEIVEGYDQLEHPLSDKFEVLAQLQSKIRVLY